MEKPENYSEVFGKEVGKQESQKMKAIHSGKRSVWSGFALFGLVGWTVTVPTLAGIALGIWLDKRYPHSSISWTLTLLISGLLTGCILAWRWIEKERTEIHKQEDHE